MNTFSGSDRPPHPSVRFPSRHFMSEYKSPEYLKDADQPTDRVRCPIHGFIRYSPNERLVIDSAYFRRLRHIRQLGLTEYAYPGANHTRFEHSLGVMEVATAMFDSLAAKKGKTMEDELSQVEWYSGEPLRKARQVVRLAALLHDTGHAPFSHAAEKVFHKEGHEALSIKVVTDPDLLGTLIDSIWPQGTASQVAALLSSDPLQPQLQFLRNIISGEIDADRTDYLLRDSYHCGVEYGKFDHRRMIGCLTLRQAPGGGLEIAIESDGIHTVEALILARFQMNAQVYFHRIRRVYDHFLIEYHKILHAEGGLPSGGVLDLNDVVLMSRMFEDARSDLNGERQVLARRIIDRKHPRQVYDTGDNADEDDFLAIKSLETELRDRYTDVYFFVDDMGGKPVSIHKLFVKGDAPGVSRRLTVFEKDGTEQQIGEKSKILAKIPKDFMCFRVFADCPDEAARKDISDFIAGKLRN